MQEQSFFIPILFPGANEILNMTKGRFGMQAYRRIKKELQEQVGLALIAARVRPVNEPVYVSFSWLEPNRRRDFDNICFAQKFVLDALVECDILQNDGRKHVRKVIHEVLDKVDPKRPGVFVTISPVALAS